MSQLFRYAVDNRYLPVLIPFGLRRSRDGVTLTDEGILQASFGFVKVGDTAREHQRRPHHPELPLVDRAGRSRLGCRRRLELRDEPGRGGLHPLHREVPSLVRRSGHSALTVTVADLDGLVSALGGTLD